MTPQERLRYHVTGAIERGEAEPIIEQAPNKAQHSPLPWHMGETAQGAIIFGIDIPIADVGSLDTRPYRYDEQLANAKLIVASVNHAEALAEALRELRDIAWPDNACVKADAALAAYESEVRQ